MGPAQLFAPDHLQISVHFRAVVQRPILNHWRKGGAQQRRNTPDYSPPAQSAPTLPAPTSQEGGGEPTARQGRVHHQV